MLLSGCGSSATPETLYQSNTVQVVQNNFEIAVYDLVSDNEYNFIQRCVKRVETLTEAYTAISTGTIQIDVLTNGLRVYDKEEKKASFIIVQKRIKKEGVIEMPISGFDALLLIRRALDYGEDLTNEEWEHIYQYLISTCPDIVNEPFIQELKQIIEEESDDD